MSEYHTTGPGTCIGAGQSEAISRLIELVTSELVNPWLFWFSEATTQTDEVNTADSFQATLLILFSFVIIAGTLEVSSKDSLLVEVSEDE
jgi:hypothetical protein